MDLTKITAWVKENPLMAAAAGIGAIALIALLVTTSSKTQQQYYQPVQLGGIAKKRRKPAKKVSLIGLQ